MDMNPIRAKGSSTSRWVEGYASCIFEWVFMYRASDE